MNNETKGLRTWVEVSKAALKNNYDEFRKLIKPGCKLMAVAKSNAYGHGLVQYAQTMEQFGADWIGVDSITEASRLRKEGIKLPILVLGYTLPENFEEALENNISLAISSFESLEALKDVIPGLTRNLEDPGSQATVRDDSKKPLSIHIKIDTGMHRQGFQLDEVETSAKYIKENLPSIAVEGIFTHFAAAKDPDFPDETEKQIEQFKKAVGIFDNFGFKPIRHAAATGGTIVFPDSHFDMVRVGIGLYGLWPSSESRAHYQDKVKLMPALTWKSIVSEVKNIPAGEGIGYDLTEKFDADGRIAIIPIGYWHGYARDLSGIGQVIIDGKRAKIVGRVSMDMVSADISGIKNVKVGDEVTLLGDGVSAYDMAALLDGSWYEVITRINPLIKRVYN